MTIAKNIRTLATVALMVVSGLAAAEGNFGSTKAEAQVTSLKRESHQTNSGQAMSELGNFAASQRSLGSKQDNEMLDLLKQKFKWIAGHAMTNLGARHTPSRYTSKAAEQSAPYMKVDFTVTLYARSF